jgi:NAD(P)-dependent dehydrogenase (short-subunit alcohol dehydrogenase family)
LQVNGAVALITGGASGLGLATAKRLADAGARVLLVDLDEESGEEAARSIEGAGFIQCDVRDAGAVEEAVKGAYETAGRIDVLVNAAGVGTASRVVGRGGALFDLEVFKFTIGVNLVGAFDVLRHVAAAMTANAPGPTGERGVIINVASVAAFDGQIGQAAYSASKGGIVAMTLPVARELGAHGIRVMTIAPGVFDTKILGMLPDEAIAALAAEAIFPKRLGDPDEFAQLVVSIVENPYLNGETIRLDAATRMSP